MAPPGRGVRPTTDRVREAVFARLRGLDGARVLDLYAGTGALGIEALSRGAAEAVFVEKARPSLDALQRNVATLGLTARARILRRDAVAAITLLGRAGERFDLIFVDPPYASGEAERALRALPAAGLLAPGGALVVERSRRHDLPDVEGLVLLDERRYGDTVVSRLGLAGGAPAGAPPDVAGEGGAESPC